MTPPDSGECDVCGKPFELLVCREPLGHAGKHLHVWVPTRDWTLLPLPLAQRTIAALEGRGDMAERYALRDELRARVEGKA